MREAQEKQVWGDNWVTQKVGVNRVIMLPAALFWLIFAWSYSERLTEVPLGSDSGYTLLSVVKLFVYFILILAVTDLAANLGPLIRRTQPRPPAAPLIFNLLTVIVVLLGHAFILK